MPPPNLFGAAAFLLIQIFLRPLKLCCGFYFRPLKHIPCCIYGTYYSYYYSYQILIEYTELFFQKSYKQLGHLLVWTSKACGHRRPIINDLLCKTYLTEDGPSRDPIFIIFVVPCFPGLGSSGRLRGVLRSLSSI